MKSLLSREEFKAEVFKRDNNKCVMCGLSAVDAHHLFDRKLWPDGGNYLNNGVSLCEECHIKAETTEYSVEKLAEAAGIKKLMVPEHLANDDDTKSGILYDKWANPYYPNGAKFRGEMWWEENCQKILAKILHEFSPYVKYPRTMHLPWSPNLQNDDRVIPNLDGLINAKEVVVTTKMDGENTSFYRGHFHARSMESTHHPSQSWVKSLHGRIQHEIPEDWRICGENLYAFHSIAYDDLKSYFQVFNIWERATALSWDETLQYCDMLDLDVVNVLYRGPFDEKILHEIEKNLDVEKDEGYVIRSTERIHCNMWRKQAAKYVRKSHVKERMVNGEMKVINWRRAAVIPNKLA